jgi:hypothetical protein
MVMAWQALTDLSVAGQIEETASLLGRRKKNQQSEFEEVKSCGWWRRRAFRRVGLNAG